MFQLPNNILPFLTLPLLFFSCNKAAEVPTNTDTPEIHTNHIHLSPEQLQIAGIETGKAEELPLSNSIGCTAYVDVPPYSLASVYTPVAGIVQSVKHLPGEYVKKGSILIRISHPDIVQVQQNFLEVYSRLAFLQQDVARQQTLAAAEAASVRRLQEVEAELAQAEAQAKGLRAQLQLLGMSPDRLAKGGEVQTSITLRAPISGYLTQVNVNQGKLVGPDELLYELVDNTHKHLEINVFAKDLPLVRKGQRIVAYLPGNDQTYEAEVHLIGKQIEEANKTVRVHGHFTVEPQELLAGTYLQARIFTDDRLAWAVPETAVIRQGDEAIVFVQEADGFSAVKIDIEAGRDSFVVIRNPQVIEGKELVLKGAYYLQNGTEAGHSH